MSARGVSYIHTFDFNWCELLFLSSLSPLTIFNITSHVIKGLVSLKMYDTDAVEYNQSSWPLPFFDTFFDTLRHIRFSVKKKMLKYWQVFDINQELSKNGYNKSEQIQHSAP